MELLGYFNKQVELSIEEGNTYKQQRNNDAARIVAEFVFLQQQAESGNPIDENRYWELRDIIHGSPSKPSLLEETAKVNLKP